MAATHFPAHSAQPAIIKQTGLFVTSWFTHQQVIFSDFAMDGFALLTLNKNSSPKKCRISKAEETSPAAASFPRRQDHLPFPNSWHGGAEPGGLKAIAKNLDPCCTKFSWGSCEWQTNKMIPLKSVWVSQQVNGHPCRGVVGKGYLQDCV